MGASSGSASGAASSGAWCPIGEGGYLQAPAAQSRGERRGEEQSFALPLCLESALWPHDFHPWDALLLVCRSSAGLSSAASSTFPASSSTECSVSSTFPASGL